MEFSGGGATLSEMYQSARRLLLSARDGVSRVERLASAPTSSSYSSSAPLVGGSSAAGVPAVAEEVRREVAQIHTLCARMDRLWRSIPAKGQRDLWKRLGDSKCFVGTEDLVLASSFSLNLRFEMADRSRAMQNSIDGLLS